MLRDKKPVTAVEGSSAEPRQAADGAGSGRPRGPWRGSLKTRRCTGTESLGVWRAQGQTLAPASAKGHEAQSLCPGGLQEPQWMGHASSFATWPSFSCWPGRGTTNQAASLSNTMSPVPPVSAFPLWEAHLGSTPQANPTLCTLQQAPLHPTRCAPAGEDTLKSSSHRRHFNHQCELQHRSLEPSACLRLPRKGWEGGQQR